MVTLIYIHGANATGHSWNYLRSKIRATNEYILEYSSSTKFESNFQNMIKSTENLDRTYIIGHSLGGIYAYYLASKMQGRCLGGMSISTPFGGVKSAYLLGFMFPFFALFQDIKPTSKVISHVANIKNIKNWTQVITHKDFSPLLKNNNDGVVTVASQHKINCDKITMNFSHNEILQSSALAGLIINKSGLNLNS